MASKKRWVDRTKYAPTNSNVPDNVRFDEALQWYHERLQREQRNRTEKEAALKQILEHIARDKDEFRSEVVAHVKDLLSPFFAKLKDNGGHLTREDIETLENSLDRITETDVDEFWDGYAKLTPREMDICTSIREGLSSKEIAAKFDLSLHTVHKHRQKIRRKLRLNNKEINLAAHLRWKFK